MPQNNILIIKLGALGDFVQSLGPMRAIRVHHPDAKITLLTTKPFASLAEKSGYVDDIWLDQRPRWHDVKGWLDLRRKFNGGHFTRVYDLQNNDRTGFYFKLFSPRPEWVGIAPGASHRNTSPHRTAGLAFDGHVQTLGLAGIKPVSVDDMQWIDTDIAALGLKRPYVLIVPGSAPTRPEKRWPAPSYAALCNTLSSRGYQPVLIGTKDEKETIDAIANNCPAALSVAGKTSLFDIVTLARSASGAVGNDTGPMHMIAPTGCPTLVLFSRFSNPVRHSPKGDNLAVTQVEELGDLDADDVFKKFEGMLR